MLSLTACSGLLFFPSKQWVRTPADINLAYEDIELVTADNIKLSAWWLKTDQPVKGTVLFLHGNAENISTHIASVHWLPERGYQVLMLDYRGYGRSEGTPSLPAVFMDIEAGFNWLKNSEDVAGKPVFLLAQSLGAAMGGFSVGDNPEFRNMLNAVVLDAGFGSYSEIAKEVASRSWLTWPFQYPVAWSMPDEYNLDAVIHQISPTPLLIIHGTQDAVIPFAEGERLFGLAVKPKSFLRYDGPHIGTFYDVGNRDLLLQFFNNSTTAQ
ncbi:hypothetical protein BST96_14200 [Oceanicoccus sagamiensis]|uniref:Serine aminopeptidase S33 domain-containing protein n=1 Tax=Oceanicoccus sagamiensis TaxID=716816 RepID=A0A1X9NH44_9GAMM|nr:hypothetical protein BST96_14200 [Oceanicoccus sagamiensis]